MNTATATPPALPRKGSKLESKPPKKMDLQAEEMEPKQYILEDATINLEESDDELDFEEVPVEPFDEMSDSDIEESLEQAVRNMHEKGYYGPSAKLSRTEEPVMTLTKHPEVIDDYIRNFLANKGLKKSLDAFQNEWYESQLSNKIGPDDLIIVPDVYQQNQELSEVVHKLKNDVQVYKDIATKARSTYDKLRKERDFHRMHHKRVVQEKNKLVGDIKKFKKQYETYEPALKQMQVKYEVAMKEKMLIKLERDRLAAKVGNLELNIRSFEKQRENRPASQGAAQNKTKQETQTRFPVDNRPNPYLSTDLPQANPEKFKPLHNVSGHNLAISAMKFHPKKPIIATVSDDKSWKLWSFPNGELIMSGKGHQDWIADCDFHPKGTQLATASGDGTVKLWDFSKGIATASLTDHTQAVWSCAFHDLGGYLISGSMDHTVKLWDLTVAKCKQTFRGHAESVNHVGFQPYTNLLYSCSGDKTISFWDGRTGICSSTLFGHMSTINHAAFSLKGNVFASCDADGVVKIWDLRNTSEAAHIDVVGANQAANKIAFDPSGRTLAVACHSGLVKFVDVFENKIKSEIKVSDDSCQAVLFDRSGEYLVASGNDGHFKVFE